MLPRQKYPRTSHLPWSPGATDDDKVLKSLAAFAGRRVVVTEKMDGCFIGRTGITMADGTQRPIRDLVTERAIGQYVMGHDGNGPVASRITNVFDNGSVGTDGWVRVRVQGTNWNTYCTPNHLFMVVDRGWTAASDLRAGDQVLELRRTTMLTPLQEQILLGKLLGDGSLHTLRGGDSAHVAFTQKAKHVGYTDWCRRGLGDVFSASCDGVSGFGTPMIKSWTKSLYSIQSAFGSMKGYARAKIVPADVASRIGPVALAFWFMDDGSLGHSAAQEDRALLHVCAFDAASIEALKGQLGRFGINAKRRESGSHPYLALDEYDAEKFFLLVAPYVPPVMQYKLPERYRGGHGWMPPVGSSGYKPWIKVRRIAAVERRAHPVERRKFDIETETHNYFANGFLVHNSNTSLYPDGFLHSRSINGVRHPSQDWVKGWWAGIASGLPEGWRVCGENMYARHSIGYDALPSYFLGFSIWNGDDVALSWDDTTTWFALLGIVPVPVLYDGLFDEAAIRRLYDDSRDREVREGYVVRVADQIPMDSFTVSVAKYVRARHVAPDAKHWRTAPVVPNGLAR